VARLGTNRTQTVDEEQTQTLDQPETTERIPTRPVLDNRRDRDTEVVDRPADDTVVERPTAAPRWAHVSVLATLGLIVGLVALGATLTGLLAPIGVALGVIGGAVSAGGLVGASRRGVTGHSIALLGMLASIAAIVLGVLAMGGYLPWLDSRTDEVARLRSWFDAHLTFMRHW
jgi:hypothetical protein